MKPLAAIFDIDGTLADTAHCHHFLEQNPKDWDGFHSAMENAPPREAVVQLCRAVALYRDPFKPISVILCTGRLESYRRPTLLWLKNLFISYRELYMRRDGDLRDSVIIKREMLQKIREDYEPIFAVDDRAKIAAMWREEGLVCFQCAAGEL